MYPIFKLWIRSHRDLPLRVYQIVNTFRYETKHTRPLIRLREITSFKEAHTAHASRADAEAQVRTAVALYQSFFQQLAVPYLITRRPDWDKFPGAEYSLAFDTLMPDGKTLQIGTIHLLGESFARTFEITYEDKDGALKFVNQTCYGISERCIASVIAIHGDDHGLVIPPKVAPVQVVIVPILFARAPAGSSEAEAVIAACRSVDEALNAAGIRTMVDDSEERPGAKYYRWEMKGVPLRIEIGPRDVRTQSCVAVRRDDFTKMSLPLAQVVPEVQRLLETIQTSMQRAAEAAMRTHLYHYEQSAPVTEEVWAELKEQAERGIIALPLCADEQCGTILEEQLGLSVLGQPFGEHDAGEEDTSTCIVCGRPGVQVYVARPY